MELLLQIKKDGLMSHKGEIDRGHPRGIRVMVSTILLLMLTTLPSKSHNK